MATLINGNLNNPVYASQDADLLAAICGNKTVVTPVGSQFAEELEDANTIKVDDGVIITKEGRRIQLDNGDIDEFLIPTGTQGQTQYYICGYHLYTDEESAELCETFVEAVSSGTDVIDEDTFRDGSTEVYVSLLRVKQEGVNITAITRLLPSGTDMNQINVGLNQINDDLSEKVDTTTFNQLPVSPNSSAFKNDNGISVVNLGNNGYRDVTARNHYLRGGNHICCDSNIEFTNIAQNAYKSISVNDVLFSGSQSAWSLINRLSFAGNASSCYSLTGKINGVDGQIWGVATTNDFGFEIGIRWTEVSNLYFRIKIASSWNAWYKVSGTIA